MEFICLLLPACVAMSIRCRRLQKVKIFHVSELVFGWAKWVLALNILTMGIITYVLRVEGVVADAFNSFSFFLKYTLIGIAFAVVLPYVVEIMEKYVELSVEIGEKN